MADYTDPTRFGGDIGVHKKMHDFARDTIRVTNPLTQSFKWKYDSRWFEMKPGEIKDEARYWTDHYAKCLADYILGQEIEKVGNDLLTKLAASNNEIMYDKWLESKRVWEKVPRKDDEKLLTKIMGSIVIGLVKKYGSDEIQEPDEMRPMGQLRDKSFEQQLLEDLSSRPIDERVVAADDVPSASMSVSDTQLESEVTLA